MSAAATIPDRTLSPDPAPPPSSKRPAARWLRLVGWMSALAALAVGVVFGIQQLKSSPNADISLPTAEARSGAFEVIVRCRGELKAGNSVQITAPTTVPELRIVWLAPQGSKVKAGDTVVRFDPSSVQNQLNEKVAALQQAQAALDQAVAEARVAGEQGKLDLANAQTQLERSRLEVSKAEIVSRLQAEESKVDLGLAEAKLRVQSAQMDLTAVSNRAKIASLTRARDKAQDEVDLMRSRLARMEVKTALGGVIYFLPNYSQGWMNAKPFKVGDQVWPGAGIAEVPDLHTLQMEAKVEEIDRGRIRTGQPVRVRIDSLPETMIPGKLVMLSPMTVMGWEWPPTRTFRAFGSLDAIDDRLQPSMNGRMDVIVDRLASAISVPSKALFSADGKPVVYVPRNGKFQPVPVRVMARNPDEAAIDGVPAGTRVAIVEPDAKDRL